MSNKKENEKIIGNGRYKCSEKQIKDLKKSVKNYQYGFHYELSMFNKYKHPFEYCSALDDYDSLLNFLTDFVLFKNVSKEEIESFINNHSQELRDMFYFEANKNFDQEDLINPYTSTYELDENFHLIRKISFSNSFEKVVKTFTFLFADMVCVLWEKYNKETISFRCSQAPKLNNIYQEDELWTDPNIIQ